MKILVTGAKEETNPIAHALKQAMHTVHRVFGETGANEVTSYLQSPDWRETHAVILLQNTFPDIELILRMFRGRCKRCVLLLVSSREGSLEWDNVIKWGATEWFVHLGYARQGAQIEALLRKLSSRPVPEKDIQELTPAIISPPVALLPQGVAVEPSTNGNALPQPGEVLPQLKPLRHTRKQCRHSAEVYETLTFFDHPIVLPVGAALVLDTLKHHYQERPGHWMSCQDPWPKISVMNEDTCRRKLRALIRIIKQTPEVARCLEHNLGYYRLVAPVIQGPPKPKVVMKLEPLVEPSH